MTVDAHWSRRLAGAVLGLGVAAAALGLTTSPALAARHAHKHVSGTQGRSAADPDGMTNGGADKPGGSGGVNRSDQDGNNGCGNDADFEDDNNGRCLGRRKAKRTPPPDDGPPDAGAGLAAISHDSLLSS